MYPFTRILTLAAAVALVGLIGASIPSLAEESATQRHTPTVDQADLNFQQAGECHLLRRAISRRACQARLWREMEIDTAENH